MTAAFFFDRQTSVIIVNRTSVFFVKLGVFSQYPHVSSGFAFVEKRSFYYGSDAANRAVSLRKYRLSWVLGRYTPENRRIFPL